MRECDICGEIKHIRKTYAKKELNKKDSIYKKLEEKHGFKRKSILCKECIKENE